MYMYIHWETNRQTDRQTDRQREIETKHKRQTEWDGQRNIHTERWVPDHFEILIKFYCNNLEGEYDLLQPLDTKMHLLPRIAKQGLQVYSVLDSNQPMYYTSWRQLVHVGAWLSIVINKNIKWAKTSKLSYKKLEFPAENY